MESLNGETALLERTAAIAASGKGVSSEEFLALMRQAPESITPSDMNKVVKMASEQVGYWEAEYMFSRADTPNAAAAAESAGWKNTWSACAETLINLAPELRDKLDEQQRMVALHYHLSRRVEYNSTRPFARVASYVFSYASFALKRIGLRSLAQAIYARGLYPAGTVGRRG